MNAVTPFSAFGDLNPDNPADLGWPATLPLEIAMRTAPIRDICEAYKISREEWDALSKNPLFLADVAHAVETLKTDGMRFKAKAKLQAEALLQTTWTLIHDPETPAAVKLDGIKSTVRWAGLEPKGGAEGGGGNNLQINIQL